MAQTLKELFPERHKVVWQPNGSFLEQYVQPIARPLVFLVYISVAAPLSWLITVFVLSPCRRKRSGSTQRRRDDVHQLIPEPPSPGAPPPLPRPRPPPKYPWPGSGHVSVIDYKLPNATNLGKVPVINYLPVGEVGHPPGCALENMTVLGNGRVIMYQSNQQNQFFATPCSDQLSATLVNENEASQPHSGNGSETLGGDTNDKNVLVLKDKTEKPDVVYV